MKLKLIKSKEEELDEVSKIYMNEFSKPPYNENWTREKALKKMKFFCEFHDLYFIMEENQVIGFIVINPNFMCPGEVAFGEEFAIKEEFQGRGIGTSVIKEIMRIYSKKGFREFMCIGDVGSKAFSLYKKLKIVPNKKDILLGRSLK